MKTCYRCKTSKPLSDFTKGGKAGTLHSYCRTCNHKERAEWNKDNAERVAEQRLYEKYKLRPEQLQKMLEDQDYTCLICPKRFKEGRSGFHIDHDHTCCPSGRSCGYCIRGLLCPGCNNKMGWYDTNAESVAAYVARPRPITEVTPPRRNNGRVAQK